MKKIILLLVIFISACGPSPKERSDIAKVTCNILGETRMFDGATRIKEVNAARQKLGEAPFLGTDRTILDAIKYNVCEKLILNDPVYKELILDYEMDAEAALAELEAQAAEANEAALAALETLAAQASASEKVQLDNPELSQFQQSYYQFDKKLTSKVANSRKVMQVSVAIMTHYDDRVVANVEKHVFALRNVMLMVMSQQTEADLADPEFRIKLAEEFKFVMNAELEVLEDFGGIEQVYLTEFAVQ